MSGINSTIIIINKKLNINNQLLFSKSCIHNIKNRIICEFKEEFGINKQVDIDSKDIFVSDDFLIEYSSEVKNSGYPESLWTSIIDLVPNPISSIDFVSMSRNEGSAYIILRHLNDLIIKGYDFYMINHKPNDKVIMEFSFPDIKKVDEETYLLSSKIITYWLDNHIYSDLGYN